MNKNTTLVVAVAILSGFLIGYLTSESLSNLNYDSKENNEGKHMMGDGTMMDNKDMGGMMHDMNEGLKGKTGDTFDKAFLQEMVVHHQGAVDMAKQVIATSKRPELIKLAEDIITAQNGEIQMMQNWEKAWFK